MTRTISWLIVGGVAALGAWSWYARPDLSLAAADVLETIPRAADASPTDRLVAEFVEAARAKPDDAHVWANLGDALMQKARDTMDVSYYGRAEVAFRKALAIDRSDLQATTGLSWVHGARHEFELSIEWANKALALDRDSQAAYGLLGDAAVEMGDYEAAFTHYQRMLDLRPDLSSYSRGAHLLYLTGNSQRAIVLMQKAVASGAPHAESTAWCRAQLALMLWHSGAVLPAEQVLEAGLADAPNNYHLLAAMGRVKASRKEYATAIGYYERAMATAPHLEIVVALADLYDLTGDRQNADKHHALVESIHDANKASGVQGDLALARYYADHDRELTRALAIAAAEYKARPNVFAADTLAWVYYKNGRYEDARRTIEKALRTKTPDAAFLFHAGMISEKLGDRPSAQRFLYQALSLNPGFHPTHARVAAETLARLAG